MTDPYRRISPMAQTYPASDIRKMFNIALNYPEAVKLTVGEPDFPTPEHIKQAGIRAIENNETKYVANAGLPDLRAAIAGKYSVRWGREVTAENVMITFGAMERSHSPSTRRSRPGRRSSSPTRASRTTWVRSTASARSPSRFPSPRTPGSRSAPMTSGRP